MSNLIDMYVIYENIHEFTKCRKWSEFPEIMDSDKFYNELRANHVYLFGKNRFDQTTTIILAQPGSELVRKKQEALKAIRNAQKFGSHSLIVVAAEMIPQYSELAYEAGFKHFQTYDYRKFYMNYTLAAGVPKHLLEKPDIDIREIDLPIIRENDIQAIWIDARPGDIVKIIRPSLVCGESIIYRRCL